jgi:opacity protein-like surface antigen
MRSTKSSSGGALDVGRGIGFQANYARRFYQTKNLGFYGEGNFLASPLQEIASENRTATRDFATAYATVGMRVKFRPSGRLVPYGLFGGGYALFEQSHNQLNGSPNQAPRFTHRGALTFGGGLDVRIWRFLAGRSEVRNFYSGNPSFNTPVGGGGFHNLVVGGGFVLRFGSSE